MIYEICMEQFTVPQFIDVEDKILGPVTIRQFLIMIVGSIIVFLAYRYGDMGTFVITLILIGGLSLTFAFVKVNGQAFHYFLLNIVQTTRKPSLRVWHKSYHKKELDFLRKEDSEIQVLKTEKKKYVQRQRIRDLSLVVNTGGYYKADE